MHGAYVAVALATLGGLVSATAALWAWTPLRHRTMDIAETIRPLSRFAYLAADRRSGHVDHYALYQGLGEIADRLRAADVLFIGNSRLMFGLPQEQVRAFFGARGISYYVMGFGHTEGLGFAEDIVERLDLHPKLIVANADGTFFTNEVSEWAALVMETGRFDALKYRAEAEATHWVRRHLHRVIPHVLELYRNEPEFIVYRSSRDGTWRVEWDRMTNDGAGVPMDDGRVDEADVRTVAIARRFQLDMAARGAQLVLCSIPSPHVSQGHGRALAEQLGVPFLAPVVDDIRHFDGSHLTPASARRYSEALLAELDGVLRTHVPELLGAPVRPREDPVP